MPTRKPAISGDSILTGTYFIQNVHYLTFLELRDPNDTYKVFSDEEKNLKNNNKLQQWDIVDLGYGKFSIVNSGSKSNANWGFGAQKRSAIVDRSNRRSTGPGVYTIQPTDVDVYWGLFNNQRTTLVELYADPYSDKNQWYIIPVN
ncbi:hypothetical protein BD410DRAFT_831859 [Rickenella mellea]|uniref:Ricin B lectin domain-containing protein n=1 Tax=Rickenella mellea TaxID=50990 RepID=A0A4Y7PP56_9AGAM|nr:hypothetical protein BD410DRAFT_831859 [Rickenella mellea]